MVVFGFIVDQGSSIVQKFIDDVGTKLRSSNITKNPFFGRVRATGIAQRGKSKDLIVLSIRPIYPNYSVWGWVAAAVTFPLGIRWLTFTWVAVGLLGFFWTKYFFISMMKLGLRKAGYKGPIEVINASESMEKTFLRED